MFLKDLQMSTPNYDATNNIPIFLDLWNVPKGRTLEILRSILMSWAAMVVMTLNADTTTQQMLDGTTRHKS